MAQEQITEKLDSATGPSDLPGSAYLVAGEHVNHAWDGSGAAPGPVANVTQQVATDPTGYNTNTHGPRGPQATMSTLSSGERADPYQGYHDNVNTAGVTQMINPQAGGDPRSSNTSPVDPDPLVPMGRPADVGPAVVDKPMRG